MSSSVDVLIVGYGPVGAALASLLGRQGVQTLVVDRNHEIVESPRAIALDNEALRILQAMDIDEAALPRVVIPTVRFRSARHGVFAAMNTSGTIDGHPKQVTFYQPALERALRARVQQHASVQVGGGIEFQSLTQTDNGVCVALRSTVGDDVSVQARYLIGADGAASKIRNQIGQAFQGQSYAEDWLIVDARQSRQPIDHVEFVCDPQRPVAHMCAPDARERWEFMLRPGETTAQMEGPEKIAELLRPWCADAPVSIERKAVYRFHARCCERFQVGRVFLVGDAAHITPPFAGQGLISGLRDAINLAWKLGRVLEGRSTPEILQSYDVERRPHARAMIDLARNMGRVIMPRSPLLANLIQGPLAWLRRFEGFRDKLENAPVKPQNAYAQGLFVPASARDRRRSPVRRGAWMPQLRLRTPDGKIILSDVLLDHRLTLLGLDVDPTSALGAAASSAWADAGGQCRSIHSAPDARRHQWLDDPFATTRVRAPWLVVLRPDLTILHDGPAAEADHLVRQALQQLSVSAPH